MMLSANEICISGLPTSIANQLNSWLSSRQMKGIVSPDNKVWITIHGGKTRDEVLEIIQLKIAELYRHELANAEAAAFLTTEKLCEAVC